MWGIKKILVLMLIAVLLLTVGCSAGKTELSGIAQGELIVNKKTNYRTTPAEVSDLVRQINTTVEPVFVDRRTISTGDDALILESFEVKRGDSVKQGDVLAVLSGTGSPSDVRQLTLELDYAVKAFQETSAAMEAFIAELEQLPAEDTYAQRIKALNIEKQQAAYELNKLNNRASLDSLSERIEKAQAALETQYIYAPFDGIVRSIENISPGSPVDPGTPLMAISKDDSLVLFSSTATNLLKYNKRVQVTVESREQSITGTGRVVSSSDMVPGYFGTFVYIKLDDPSIMGSATEAKVSCDYTLLKDAIIIPRVGINTEKGKQYVTILDGDAVRKRYVIGGPQLVNEMAVLQGVEPGDMIITSQFTS